jgi:iron complex outermembrane receptor protein/vitamin B12 transporter
MNARIFVSLCLLVALSAILASSALAQSSSGAAQTITGAVVDPNGDALPRATVRLLDSAGNQLGRSLTDAQGRFRFASLPDAQYTVIAELVGFQTVSMQLRPGASVKITLPLAPVREQVVVTATRTDAPSSQLAASVSVATAQETENRLLLPISETLRKVLLDGIVLNDAGGPFNFGNLMAENIDRVEMVRGPQSALFGSDAMASVVQLFTQRGRSETLRPRFTLGGEGGNNHTWRTRAGMNGEAGLLDYSLHWARLSTDNREPNNAFHNTSLSSNVGLALGERTSLRVISRGELGRVGIPGQTAFGRPDRDAVERRRDADLGARFWNQTTSSWEQQLRYGFYQSRQLSRNLIADPFFVPRFEDRVAQCFDSVTMVVDDCEFFDFPGDFLNHIRRQQLTYQSDWRGS